MIGESFLALSAGDVARSARKLAPVERFARLLGWVLPSDDHASIRLAAEFGPTDSPVAPAEAKAAEQGGLAPTLDSPALDLVAAAKESGQARRVDRGHRVGRSRDARRSPGSAGAPGADARRAGQGRRGRRGARRIEGPGAGVDRPRTRPTSTAGPS